MQTYAENISLPLFTYFQLILSKYFTLKMALSMFTHGLVWA